jgi:hypothetical protein
MAMRIKTDGNHIILQDEADVDIFDRAKIAVGFRLNDAKDKIFFVLENPVFRETRLGGDVDYAYTDIVNGDAADAPFASLEALKTYLRENTGFGRSEDQN